MASSSEPLLPATLPHNNVTDGVDIESESSSQPLLPAPLPSVPLPLFALHSNVTAVVELELVGSNLQLELLKNQKHADNILNELVNHTGFLVLYTMGGLMLQASNTVGCISAGIIMFIVTLTFMGGLTIGYKMAKLKLERMKVPINDLNQKKKNLTDQAISIRDREARRMEKELEGGDDDDVDDVGNDAAQLSAMVRAESIVSRLNALIDSCDMTAFDDINRKMFIYIFVCGGVYLLVVAIFFIFNNCGLSFLCRFSPNMCPI